MVVIKCFGITKEIIGDENIQLAFDKLSVAELRDHLHNRHKEFDSLKGFMVAINQEYALDNEIINSGDEVAIIPPVSGG